MALISYDIVEEILRVAEAYVDQQHERLVRLSEAQEAEQASTTSPEPSLDD